MTIRIFRCRHCNHAMRMSHDSCGRCNEYKRPYQRLYFYVLPLLLILITAPNLVTV
jgi:hypothetical protein